MSFLLDKTTSLDRIPSDITGLRGGLSDYLQNALAGLDQGPDDSFIQNILDPARRLFAQQRTEALAQSKEAAGNLTGSSFANQLGTTVNRSLSSEDAILADLLNQERARILQAIVGFGTAGVAPPQNVVQPGLISSLAQGAGAAAPFFKFGGGGALGT